MAHAVVLTIHICFGAAGVLLGPVVVWLASRGKIDRTTQWFELAVAGVCLSALGLAALDIRTLWWLVPISFGTFAFIVRGQHARKHRRDRWTASAVRGYGGAYIALWTAILVVSADSSVLTWAGPTIIGAPVVEWLAFRTHRAPATRVADVGAIRRT